MNPSPKPLTSTIKNILGKSVVGVSLCPFGIYIDKDQPDKYIFNHEKIHWVQQLEMLIVPFYIWYFAEYIIRKFTNKGQAYISISFEREAYTNQYDLNYLKKRKPYAWFKYIRKRKFKMKMNEKV